MNRAINIVEVNTPALEKEFLEINATLNKTNPHYIRPLDNEVLQVFDRNKNKLFKSDIFDIHSTETEMQKTLTLHHQYIN